MLMQYFGYHGATRTLLLTLTLMVTNFWLTKLNQFNGNFVDAEMVKAFITSGENIQRFGP